MIPRSTRDAPVPGPSPARHAPGLRRETLKRFGRFLCTGGVAALVDVLLFALLKTLGIAAFAAATASFLVAAAVSYLLASLFIYHRRPSLGMLAKFLASYTVGLAVNVSMTLMALAWLGLPPMAAKLFGIAVASVFNFLVMNFVLFARARKKDALTG